MESYDVIIIGAGPAGGNCARELSKLGHSVLLIEQSKVIGIPNFSTGGTPNETMKVFNLPKKITDSPWNSILVASKNERAEFLFGKTMGYVLNYKLLKQFLAKQAKNHGVEIICGAHVDEALLKDNSVIGVNFSENGQKRKAFAKVVVDASGGRAVLSQKLGLIKTDERNLAVGIEYYMKNVDLERKGRLDNYFGPSYVPGGYAWIFPSGLTTAKVGLASIIPTKPKLNLLRLLKKFAGTNPQTKNAIQTDIHSGSLFSDGGIRNHVLNGFIAIGDAAAQNNPLIGEGIKHALYSGLFAAETIDSALQKRNTGEKFLRPYNERWKSYVGNKWKISLWLQKLMYNPKQGEKLIDDFVKVLSEYEPERLFEIAFNYRFELMNKGLPKFLKIISSAAFKVLINK